MSGQPETAVRPSCSRFLVRSLDEMSLQPGTKLAHYEVLSPIGKGGMGEVYHARDITLDRDVAIKVLPEEFVTDDQRLARLEREAKLLASLNHPNIASIYGFESNALVLELVEGPTLSERIAKGPMPVDEVLVIAKQIAAALEAGHASGVIHRDLKPANIKLKQDGTVKVLDYGLAKALVGDVSDESDHEMSQSPTVTRQGTQLGVILGTAPYMSPEQAKGESLDEGTDVWAFGAVVYEMLTGHRAFRGEGVSEVLASIIKSEPDWDALPSTCPSNVTALVRMCLSKNPRERLRHLGDACLVMDMAVVGSQARSAEVVSSTSWLSQGVPWAIAAVAIGFSIFTASTRDEPKARSRQLSVLVPENLPLMDSSAPSVAISSDGSKLAFVATDGDTSRLFLRDIHERAVVPVNGSDGADSPFFALDGRSLVFRSGVVGSRSLRRIAVDRGPAVTLWDGGGMNGMSWDIDGALVGGRWPDIGIWRLSPDGENTDRVTERDGNNWQYFPDVLRDRRAILFTAHKGAAGKDTDVLELDTGERRTLIRNSTSAKYVPTGHVVFARENTLFAVPFDIDSLEPSGDVVPVVENLSVHAFGGAHYSFSEEGTLAYVPKPERGSEDHAILLVDRDGNQEPLLEEGFYDHPRLSPDGRHLVVQDSEYMGGDIWTYDIERGVLSRLTLHGAGGSPVWSPDGSRVVFASSRAGTFNLFWKDVRSDVPVTQVAPHDYWQTPNDWSADGSLIAFLVRHPSTGDDIWLYSIEEDSARPFLATEFNERSPSFSRDGGWIAYESTETGEPEIFVRPLNSDARSVRVSLAGGSSPRFSRAGDELFFIRGADLMAVPIVTKPSLSVGTPVALFNARFRLSRSFEGGVSYDVAADGEHFVIVRDAEVAPVNEIRVVFDWFEELERLAPVSR